MKFNFKKISAIGASILMAGMSLGFAAAAAYPAPFIQGGTANVAIVYGSNANILDGIEAGHIQTNLQSKMGASVRTSDVVTGGDSYKFEKTSTAFHLGDGYTTITSTVDKDEMPNLLADGKYLDDDNDEIDYSQKIVMDSANTLGMFDDDDYESNSPTVGFKIADGATIATYTLTFNDALLVTDMPTTELPIMGKKYYVLSNTSTTITLLDAAVTGNVQEGEEINLEVGETTYTISASIFDTVNSKVKMLINGETTNLLAATETQKLSDGSYIGIKEVIVQNFAGGANQVEFSIGKGKLKLSDADVEVQINDVNVAGVESDFSLTANTLSNIEIAWKASDDLFITETSSITMPGFNTIRLSFEGLNYPAEEVIEVKQGGTTYASFNNFPLKTGVKTIDFLYGNSVSFTAIGKDADSRLLTDANSDVNITFNKSQDDYFIASWTDTSSAQSYLMRATNFITDTVDKADIQYWKDGAWATAKSKAKETDEISVDGIYLTVGRVNNALDTIELWETSASTATSITSFNTLYSKEGMTVYLPYENSTAMTLNNATAYASHAAACTAMNALGYQPGELYTGTVTFNFTIGAGTPGVGTVNNCSTTFDLVMIEEDKSDNLYSGDFINVTLGWDTSSVKEVEVSSYATSNADATSAEIGTTDVWRDFTYSELATEILNNKPSSGQKSIKLIYHGSEVAANVRISSPDAVIVAGTPATGGIGQLGYVVYKDSEISSVATKNLIIVGGSCINSAAAALVGGAYCGDAWTTATGVGSGQFLIKGYANPSIAPTKMALLVAGYDAADTINAATYLMTRTIDTSKAYKGTSATSAELITTETA